MSVCVSVQYLSVRGQYPVIDPRRTAGAGPWRYGYMLAHDGIQVNVERSPSLGACEMRVTLATSLSEPKDVLAWNLYSNSSSDRIGSAGLGLSSSMVIRSALRAGQACGTGTDTVVLRRRRPPPDDWTAFYWFDPRDFWDFWGGCHVTFEWIADWGGSGVWGDATPPVRYPVVKVSDRTLMTDGTTFSLAAGGTGFTVSQAWLNTGIFGLSGTAVPAMALPALPVDGTLLAEFPGFPTSGVYLTYGGAPFATDSAFRTRRGFTPAQEVMLPPGATARLPSVPIDGTLVREENGAPVYLAEGGLLRWVKSQAVMDARCLSWRHVRLVPDQALATLPRGADLELP